jgi:hypothetical protein
MDGKETPEEIKEWFLREVAKLWPIAGNGLSLRKNRCIRPSCSACLTGEGHPYYALQFKRRGRQTSLYVPDDLAEEVAQAVENGRRLRELAVEAGRRYIQTLKRKRRKEEK